jgi:hypothetical protein
VVVIRWWWSVRSQLIRTLWRHRWALRFRQSHSLPLYKSMVGGHAALYKVSVLRYPSMAMVPLFKAPPHGCPPSDVRRVLSVLIELVLHFPFFCSVSVILCSREHDLLVAALHWCAFPPPSNSHVSWPMSTRKGGQEPGLVTTVEPLVDLSNKKRAGILFPLSFSKIIFIIIII